ncbi:hypothetical protein SPRG_07794 [Saprolegnia parasitica CBS 223.65]|uniref:Uncharacterized protein n=1 Tax=Saprolegnia parasitica (strain CBS 223.65) TaxID=695850 RepID=A0A067C8J0_SAPPC|nr:hypothetical protein SPRG_07794 [Saprolegnia parasitica CBS 223.65]KDO27084.1 hypothetical protein SPRG_07794 [Saprolegnia parasitica CBS 223.65]|eukprot:XP_012202178.1 hypothetical protein SPRG_07794 [Saprolegnia parasitica CBS 223.65]
MDDDSYWAQHAALKAAHHDSAVQVFQSFHKTLQQWHGTDEQRTKLERLVKYVEYCVEVLDDEATCRGSEDLDRVHKYIHSIVLPYLSKLRVEEVSFGRKASSASYVSMTTTASSTADGALHPTTTTTTWADDSASFGSNSSRPDTSDVYWLQLAALKDKYETDVLTVRTALRQHLTDRGRDATSSLHDIEHCAALLAEDRGTHAARSLDELDGVWQCIDRVVLPYMSVLTAPTTATASSDTIESTTPYWREHAMLSATYRHDVLAVEHAYETYVTHMNDPMHQAKKDRVRRLLERVQWVRSVLDEDAETANERSMEELELVYSYILKYVAPYLNKAAAKEAVPST